VARRVLLVSFRLKALSDRPPRLVRRVGETDSERVARADLFSPDDDGYDAGAADVAPRGSGRGRRP
jgi:hypothetical protein